MVAQPVQGAGVMVVCVGGEIRFDPGDGRVARGDVAAVAAAVLADASTIGRSIPFGNGSTPIAEAIAA